MAECRHRAQSRAAARSGQAGEPLKDIPMNRYINPGTVGVCGAGCRGRGEERALLEQLVELSVRQNQSLVDLLGAVNALTATLLARL